MNILTETLPTAIEIAHTEYPINYDFKTCLRVILAFEDNELTPQEKQVILLSSVYQTVPPDVVQAVEKAHLFLNGGEISTQDDAPMRLYSFAKDANFIYAAFKQTHGIDLQTDNLHWWQFLALFMDLGSETTFCQLAAMRKRLLTGTATKEEKKIARDMPDIFDLPQVDNRTLEEKELENDFLNKVQQMQARNKA